MTRITKLFIAIATIALLYSCSGTKSTKQLFNDGWQFAISDATIDQVDNITGWEPVSLPHTPVITPKVMEGQWQGTCWYKKTFELPSSAKGQRLILRFGAAMNISEFWVNGHKVKTHMGGYLPVVFDFTDAARPGKENTILVKLDNTDNEITGPKPMHRLDFNMHGGLYRDAWLMIKNPLHITDPILANKPASGGIFVTYPVAQKDTAVVQVQTHVQNSHKKTKSFIVVNEIWKADKKLYSKMSKKVKLEADTDNEVSMQLGMANPELWSPQTPNLYTLKTKIVVNGSETDIEETQIGIRRIKISEGKFEINGEEMFLRGVNRHQEYPHVGYALSNEAQYRDAHKIKSAGFDYIRLSHYPHSPAFMQACNELGIVVLDAILGWQYYSKNPEFQEQIYRTAHDLVRRDRNHPCVIAWEVSLNESWMDEPFIDELTRIAHAEYPGNQCYTAGWQEYGYDIFLQARQHRLRHYSEPDKPYSVSEYGDWEYYAQNAGLNQDNWYGLKQADRSSRQLLSDGEKRLLQQATNVQEAHNDNFNTPAFADSYWVMYDYNRGYSNDLEASGLASIYRVPKFSYYFYQSQRPATELSENYQSGPMVHIASWWTPESPLNVRVYSNADEVELTLNGKSLGHQKPDQNRISQNLLHPPFTFNIKQFEAGELLDKAFINGEEVATHSVKTPGTATALDLTIDESGKAPKAGVNDVIFVHAKLLDENGTIVRQNNVEVNFEIEGDAQVLNPETIKTAAGIATALVKIGDTGKPVTIKASSNNFTAQTEITFE
jgi:beta-galactosidase